MENHLPHTERTMWTPLRSSNGEPTDEPKSKNSGSPFFWFFLFVMAPIGVIVYLLYNYSEYIPYSWYAPDPNRMAFTINVG